MFMFMQNKSLFYRMSFKLEICGTVNSGIEGRTCGHVVLMQLHECDSMWIIQTLKESVTRTFLLFFEDFLLLHQWLKNTTR